MPENFVYGEDFTDAREIPAFAGMTRREREGMSNSCLHLVNYSCIMDVFSKRCCPLDGNFIY